MPHAEDWCDELPSHGIGADRARPRTGVDRSAGLGGRLQLVRPLAGRHSDRAGHDADLYPVCLDDPDLDRSEPDLLPGAENFLGHPSHYYSAMSKPLASRQPSPVVGTHQPPEVERLRALSRLLDNAFTVPGTQFRFGLDALIGLVPGLGDAVSAVFSGYLILQA